MNTVRQDGMWNLYRDGITQSMLSVYLTCKEKFRLSYIEGYKKANLYQEAADFGTFFHDGLNILYTGYRAANYSPAAFNPLEYAEKAVDWLYDKDKNIIINSGRICGIDEEIEALYFRSEIIRVLLKTYIHVYSTDFTDKRRWVALEELFEFTVTTSRNNAVPVRGKWDGAYINKAERMILFETKTKGKISDSQIMALLNGDLQSFLYMLSMYKKFGEFPSGLCYNVVRRYNLRKKEKETQKEFTARICADIISRPEHYFTRYPASVSERAIRDFESNLNIIIDELETWYLGEGMHYRNSKACISGDYACDFINLCVSKSKVGLDTRSGLFTELGVENVPVF